MRKVKEICCFGIFIAVLCCFVLVSTFVLTPKREDFGSMWQRFLLEEDNSIDLMFFGSSLVYCDVIPAVFYEETGISSYVMAGPMQNMPTTYYYVKQMYENQNPALIAIEVTGVFFPEETDFNLINIGYMPYNSNRLGAVINGALPSERLGLLFPLYIYHDRWEEINKSDLLPYTEDALAGYTYLNDALENPVLEEREVVFSQENYEKNIAYLEKITELAKEKGSEVLLYITPSYRRLDSKYLGMLAEDMERFAGDFITFIDFNEEFDHLGINIAEDFYDTAHFNYRGAEKFTAYFAEFMNENYDLLQTPDNELWQDRAEYYKELVLQ